MNNRNLVYILVLFILQLTSCDDVRFIDLSGEWYVEIDSIRGTVKLPGSLSENKLGIEVKDSAVDRLSEEYHYEGKAIYSKIIDIPKKWVNQPLELFIERTKPSTLYIDDVLVGSESSVSTPHRYILRNGLSHGRHTIKIIIDNTRTLLPVGGSHAYSKHTQTNWNGMIGNIYLRRLNDLDICNLRIDSSINGDCLLSLDLFNNIQECKSEVFELKVVDSIGNVCFKKQYMRRITNDTKELKFFFNILNPQLWDEYNPFVYEVILKSNSGIYTSKKFGIRNFKAENGKFKNNDRIVFLRGKHDGCVFPLTGYTAMDKKDWLRSFRISKSYGINHIRCHSWTPPSAAFEAADELGIFLQVELPLWGQYKKKDSATLKYMMAEGEKIIKSYGNHPSFVILSLGNELTGDTIAMRNVVNHLKQIDGRHLYAMGTNNFFLKPENI